MSDRVEMLVRVFSLKHGLNLPHAVWQRYRKADTNGQGVAHYEAADRTAVINGHGVFWTIDENDSTRLFLHSPKRVLGRLEALQGEGVEYV